MAQTTLQRRNPLTPPTSCANHPRNHIFPIASDPAPMDDKTFQEHFGGQPARRESTVLRPEAPNAGASLRRGADQAAQTAKAVGDALNNKASPLPNQPNTGGPRYDRYRGKQVVK